MTQQKTAPRGTREPERLDFGYHALWTYGHLIPAAAFAAAAAASANLGGPGWLTFTATAASLWALAGFVVMRFVVRMNELGPLPSSEFAPGEARVLDLGCGAGRTSVIVAQGRPQSRVVALDNFSADYIDGHGEAKTRSNLRAAGVEDRVEIREGDMRRIPFPDASFDGVVSSAAIDHLERGDIEIALAETNRVLKPGGQVLLWLIVPNLWNFIAFGPLFSLHNTNATRRDWREMLAAAGFRLDAEGTARGLAWMLAIQTGDPAKIRVQDPAPRRAIPRHAFWLAGALLAAGAGLSLLGQDGAGLWTAGAGVVAIHVGAAFFGLTAIRGWLHRRPRRNT